jgi:hypothetical protein
MASFDDRLDKVNADKNQSFAASIVSLTSDRHESMNADTENAVADFLEQRTLHFLVMQVKRVMKMPLLTPMGGESYEIDAMSQQFIGALVGQIDGRRIFFGCADLMGFEFACIVGEHISSAVHRYGRGGERAMHRQPERGNSSHTKIDPRILNLNDSGMRNRSSLAWIGRSSRIERAMPPGPSGDHRLYLIRQCQG